LNADFSIITAKKENSNTLTINGIFDDADFGVLVFFIEFDADHVDAPVFIFLGMGLEVIKSSRHHFFLFSAGDCFYRQPKAAVAAAFHFYEDQGVPLSGDDIDFPVSAAEISFDDFIAMFGEVGAGQFFAQPARLLVIQLRPPSA